MRRMVIRIVSAAVGHVTVRLPAMVVHLVVEEPCRLSTAPIEVHILIPRSLFIQFQTLCFP